MKRVGNVHLETPRLILREFRPSDWKAVHEYARVPKVSRFMPWGPNTPAQSRAAVKYFIACRRKTRRVTYELAITLKENGRLIGGCGLRVKDEVNLAGDIGYVLHPDYWNRGLVTEAATFLLDFCFNRLGLHRIWCTHDPRNHASGKVMRKIGMRREGLMRHHMLQKGRWRDSVFYGILSGDPRPQR